MGVGVRGAFSSGFGVNGQNSLGWDPAPEQTESYPLTWVSTVVVRNVSSILFRVPSGLENTFIGEESLLAVI